MTEQEYIEKRVQDQIQWYSDKSGWNQKWYKRLKIIELVGAVSIPFLVTFINDFYIGLIGAIVAVVAGLLSIYKYQENWIKYRTTSESLKHQLYLFQTKAEPYNDEQAFSNFVHTIERLISKENSEWQNYMIEKKED